MVKNNYLLMKSWDKFISESLFSFNKKIKNQLEIVWRFDKQYNNIKNYLDNLPVIRVCSMSLMAECVDEWINNNLIGKEISFVIKSKDNFDDMRNYSFNKKSFTKPKVLNRSESVASHIILYYEDGTREKRTYVEVLFMLYVKTNVIRKFDEVDPFGEENWETY